MWAALGVYAASAGCAGCAHFHFALQRRRAIGAAGADSTAPAPAAMQSEPTTAGDNTTAAGDVVAAANPPALPPLELSFPAKFAFGTTLAASTALLTYRQSKNGVETLGWGLASLLFLPLNLTGVEIVPPMVLNVAVPPSLRKLGSFLCACSMTVVGVVAVRRFYSDSACYVAVNTLAAAPLALEVGDWVVRHHRQVQERVDAAVRRWTSADGGVLRSLDVYVTCCCRLLFRSPLHVRGSNRVARGPAAASANRCLSPNQSGIGQITMPCLFPFSFVLGCCSRGGGVVMGMVWQSSSSSSAIDHRTGTSLSWWRRCCRSAPAAAALRRKQRSLRMRQGISAGRTTPSGHLPCAP